MVGSGLDVLKVSCDGVSPEIYEQYRIGGKVEDVMSNIDKIIAKKKEMKTSKPKIIWKYLVFKHNREEVELAKNIAAEKGIEFEASGMRIDCGREIFEDIHESVKRDFAWIPDDQEYNNYLDLEKKRDFCGKPWTTLSINWDGEVAPCGAIYDAKKYSYGNLLEKSFKDVWNSDKYVKAREIILEKATDGDNIVCLICKRNGYQFF